MSNLNNFAFTGRVTRDPELKIIPSGKETATIGIAINSVSGGGENKKEEVLFLDLVLWEKRAVNAVNMLGKGCLVSGSGRLKKREWTAKDGTVKSSLEVAVNDIEFITMKKRDEAPAAAPTEDDSDLLG